ncbi:PREDICTED: nuclear pore complex protein NUP107 isoform X1 [Nelumbo nucifera]|uniref:Nuclear pore complex protein n=1 Tax=Nelumbo nucifera TaxID=4432 RepID=A0A1U8AH47_NELNU|nr:PREDICTED: nuclear pore complex protein NUP107 isoform X1 [Nelumbo nucifera]
MDVDMDTSPSYFDPEDLSTREQFRRYGKRRSPSSISPPQEGLISRFSVAGILFDEHSIQRRPNAALFLEEIKQEVENFEDDGLEGIPTKTPYSSKRRLSVEGHGLSEANDALDSFRQVPSLLKSCKHEDEVLADCGETTFALFASLLDSALQGLMPIPDLILRFENACRSVSESIRYGSNGRQRAVEDKLMRQKARLLLDEAASWSLLWHLFGKGNEELPEDLILSPSTSHLEACQFVMTDHTAQLCLRIVQWLEGLASEALELENRVRGCHVGSYLPNSGVWHHTQRILKKGSADSTIVQHLDFDAPTREIAHQLLDDKKQDESLLEDIWTLLRAGRLEEACELCRSAGQPWRAATICPFGGFDNFPSIEAVVKSGKNRTLQAIELESGIGHQWRLWKWASYCASEKIAEQDGGKYETAVFASQCSNLKRMLPLCTDWESACWAMAKSWLDVQVDLELARFQPGGHEQLKSNGGAIETSPGHGDQTFHTPGPESWPCHVLSQQPRDLSSLLQKLHSGDMVHEAVSRGCKEQHRQIEMNLMVGDIPHLLELLWSWISPSEDDQNVFRPHGDPQMIRFGAHLVLVLRYLLADQMKDTFREKLMTVGDLILHMYAMFLFSKQHEELVGIYASQLASHRCIDLFVHMMELRINASVHVKYKIFLSAMEYLPISPGDDTKGSFEEIIERVLSRSRESRLGKCNEASSDVLEQQRLQSLQKAMVIQWLCFTPPSTINDAEVVSAKLLSKALVHSNVLFREFALISMWRVPKLPIGAHMLLSFLVEPLKQPTKVLLSLEDHDIPENLKEFQDWSKYYSCDATYRNWLKIELENAAVSLDEISPEEGQRAIAAAKEMLRASLLLLSRKESPWLVVNEDHFYESEDPVFLELHATALLCLPSGECMYPDATSCTTLTSALYSSVSEEVVLKRQLMVNVSISTRNSCCIEVVLRCLAVEGDGLGPQDNSDGGILATVLAAGFKGELVRFQAGVTLDISRLDAWYSSKDGSLENPATYIVRGLCRRCCLPEIVLRCMQVSVSLVESGETPEDHDELIELVAHPEFGLLQLFSQHQLQEFLLFEREYSICKMELQEEPFAGHS